MSRVNHKQSRPHEPGLAQQWGLLVSLFLSVSLPLLIALQYVLWDCMSRRIKGKKYTIKKVLKPNPRYMYLQQVCDMTQLQVSFGNTFFPTYCYDSWPAWPTYKDQQISFHLSKRCIFREFAISLGERGQVEKLYNRLSQFIRNCSVQCLNLNIGHQRERGIATAS